MMLLKRPRCTSDFYNETYESTTKKEEALVNYLDYTHALLNILTLVRGKKERHHREFISELLKTRVC